MVSGYDADALIDARATRPILEHIANKWSVLILTVLCTRPSRFNEIMRRLDGITHKALADALSGWSATGSYGARCCRRRRSVSSMRSRRWVSRCRRRSPRYTIGLSPTGLSWNARKRISTACGVDDA